MDKQGSVQRDRLSSANQIAATVLSFPQGPGLVIGLFPWMITHWREGTPYPLAVKVAGIVLIMVGGTLTAATFARFPKEGGGVPFPTDPPSSRKVIVGGPYRYVRNPMYLSYVPEMVGLTLLLGMPVLLVYTAGLFLFLFLFVRLWEERTKAKRFGAEYEAYLRRVPGWWPRLPQGPA
jgi:protein-S-isoprenylcysteine O-methyltransferase Ste14